MLATAFRPSSPARHTQSSKLVTTWAEHGISSNIPVFDQTATYTHSAFHGGHGQTQKQSQTAPSIMKYIKETAAVTGIDQKIQYHRKVLSANWSTEQQQWTLDVQVNGEKIKRVNGKFIIFSTGYYSYDEPLDVEIPGIENFKGLKVHPQFWPEKLDYANKKVVVIGKPSSHYLHATANSHPRLRRNRNHTPPEPRRDRRARNNAAALTRLHNLPPRRRRNG